VAGRPRERLFNLPTEELFNACRDFGVKVKVDVSTSHDFFFLKNLFTR
jgi:hypothetical protein